MLEIIAYLAPAVVLFVVAALCGIVCAVACTLYFRRTREYAQIERMMMFAVIVLSAFACGIAFNLGSDIAWRATMFIVFPLMGAGIWAYMRVVRVLVDQGLVDLRDPSEW